MSQGDFHNDLEYEVWTRALFAAMHRVDAKAAVKEADYATRVVRENISEHRAKAPKVEPPNGGDRKIALPFPR